MPKSSRAEAASKGRNYTVDQQQDAFLDDICQNFKEKQEKGIPLKHNRLDKIKNPFFKDSLTEEKIRKLLKEYSRQGNSDLVIV